METGGALVVLVGHCAPNVLIFLEGVFLLLLAIVTEVPPGVGLPRFLSLSSFSIANYVAGAHHLESEWYLFSFRTFSNDEG
jgi:hypothetical protein